MKKVIAVLSMLHQSPRRIGSIERRFRGRPVLAWTLERLAACRHIAGRVVLCWEDQVAHVQGAAMPSGATFVSKGARQPLASLDAATASLKWTDGWRGGLLGACHADTGFYGRFVDEARESAGADSVVLVDPYAGLVDPELVDGLIEHARLHPDIRYCFSPAAPGFSGMLLTAESLKQLAATETHPGRLLNYFPDLPGRDPIGKEECAPVPTAVARTLHRFTLDSDRQVARIERATESLKGTLRHARAEELVGLMNTAAVGDALPREVVVELNTKRATRPVHLPVRHLSVERCDLSFDVARRIFGELATLDDSRLTLAGVGDPLLHPQAMELITAAHEAGVFALHVETDLAECSPQVLDALAASPIDVLTVHVPALTAETYLKMMDVDGMAAVMQNIRHFLLHRQSLGRATPILAPTFTKCADNVHEMEAWYDHWLRAVGAAVIGWPSNCAGQIADASVADMSPPRRVGCRRLANRLTIHSDGAIVACENDVMGRHPLGHVSQDLIAEAWQSRMPGMRAMHAAGDFTQLALCASCRDWHRP